MRINQIQHQCVVDSAYHYDRPNGLDEYVLILSHGKAFFHADGVRYLLKPYQVFIYDKKQPQFFHSTGEDFCHDWLHFDMTEEDVTFFCTLDIPFGKPLLLSDPFVLSELIKTMASEYSSRSQHREAMLDLYLRCFLMKLSDMIHVQREHNVDHPYFQSMCSLRNELYSFPYYNWTLKMMADRAMMSTSWLQHNWKEIFGCCYQDDLVCSRVEYAKNLLYHTNETVERIAILCGYNNSTHFMRQFKKCTALTPSAYRKKFSGRDQKDVALREFEKQIDFDRNRKQPKVSC